MKKLTIITINLNNVSGLQKTVESVVNQTFTDFEYIIIDGGSTDGSVDVIKEFKDKITFWVSEPDKGIFNAMNKGICKARGEYLLFLNSGDWLSDNNVILDFINSKFTESIISGDIYLWHSNFKIILRQSYSNEEIHYGNFFNGSLPHSASFIKKVLFDKYGMYSEEFKIVSDWEFFFKVLIIYESSYLHFKRVISFFDINGISNDERFRNLQNYERNIVLESNYPLFYKAYKNLSEKYNSLILHEIKYEEYMNLLNGKFSFIIKSILFLKKKRINYR